jgi:hypothetical protein
MEEPFMLILAGHIKITVLDFDAKVGILRALCDAV